MSETVADGKTSAHRQARRILRIASERARHEAHIVAHLRSHSLVIIPTPTGWEVRDDATDGQRIAAKLHELARNYSQKK